MAVTYTKDIFPLFRPVDIAHMKPMRVLLGDASWMTDPSSDHANAKLVFERLSDGSMPPDAPWEKSQLDLYQSWMSDGYQI